MQDLEDDLIWDLGLGLWTWDFGLRFLIFVTLSGQRPKTEAQRPNLKKLCNPTGFHKRSRHISYSVAGRADP